MNFNGLTELTNLISIEIDLGKEDTAQGLFFSQHPVFYSQYQYTIIITNINNCFYHYIHQNLIFPHQIHLVCRMSELKVATLTFQTHIIIFSNNEYLFFNSRSMFWGEQVYDTLYF